MALIKKIILLSGPFFMMSFLGLAGVLGVIQHRLPFFFDCWTDPQTQEKICRVLETTNQQAVWFIGEFAVVVALAIGAGWVLMPEKRTIITNAPFGIALHNRLLEWRQMANQEDPVVAAHVSEVEYLIEQYKRSSSPSAPALPRKGVIDESKIRTQSQK